MAGTHEWTAGGGVGGGGGGGGDARSWLEQLGGANSRQGWGARQEAAAETNWPRHNKDVASREGDDG